MDPESVQADTNTNTNTNTINYNATTPSQQRRFGSGFGGTVQVQTPDSCAKSVVSHSSQEEELQAIKRKRVTFDRTPPGAAKGSSGSTVDTKPSPRKPMASPAASIDASIIQAQKSKYSAKYVTLDDSGDKYNRNPDGTVNYPIETRYGIVLDYSIFGSSAVGVDLNDITESIVASKKKALESGMSKKARLDITPRKTNFRRARRMSPKHVLASDTDIAPKASADLAVATPKKTLPFNFMPDGESSSSREGSSSLLNKPLGSDSSSSSTSKPKQTIGMAVVSGSVAFKVAASGPLPAKGWGDMFASKVVGEWRCDGCYITNTPDAEKCVSCNLPKGAKGGKPGEGDPEESKDKSSKSSGPPAGFESSNAGAWNSSSSSKGTSTGAFTFAAPVTDAAAVRGAPVSTGGFTFFAPQITTDDKNKDGAPASGGGFTFDALGGFTFGAPQPSTDDKNKDDAPVSEGGFTYGAPAPAATEKKDIHSQ